MSEHVLKLDKKTPNTHILKVVTCLEIIPLIYIIYHLLQGDRIKRDSMIEVLIKKAGRNATNKKKTAPDGCRLVAISETISHKSIVAFLNFSSPFSLIEDRQACCGCDGLDGLTKGNTILKA